MKINCTLTISKSGTVQVTDDKGKMLLAFHVSKETMYLTMRAVDIGAAFRAILEERFSTTRRVRKIRRIKR